MFVAGGCIAWFRLHSTRPWGDCRCGCRLAGALVVNEIGGYWGHRWSHEVPFLWRFHVIHHSAEEIDWLVTVKSHPFDIFFTRFCAMVPLYVVGLVQPFGNRVDYVPAVITVVTMYWAYFIHANLKWRFGWLEWLISTPGFHHWHHTNDSPEVLNKNYAATFPWVDKCFGTLYLPGEWPAKYGSDTPIASGVAGQLLDPLSPARTRQNPDLFPGGHANAARHHVIVRSHDAIQQPRIDPDQGSQRSPALGMDQLDQRRGLVIIRASAAGLKPQQLLQAPPRPTRRAGPPCSPGSSSRSSSGRYTRPFSASSRTSRSTLVNWKAMPHFSANSRASLRSNPKM